MDDIVTAVNTIDLSTVITAASTVGIVGLGAWVGWRLACKFLNRGVGK